jgi:hypothetical protein
MVNHGSMTFGGAWQAAVAGPERDKMDRNALFLIPFR